MKVVKLVPCFPHFMHRRQEVFTNGPKSYESWLEVFRTLIDVETTIDNGCDTDVILYYRSMTGSDLGREEVFQHHLTKTKNGTIYVKELLNDHLTGNGFAIILDFLKSEMVDDYDYMIFNEDDIVILKGSDGYIKETVDMLEKKNRVENLVDSEVFHVISYSVAVTHYAPHIGGLFAMIPIKPLKDNVDNFPSIVAGDELKINIWALESVGAEFYRIGYLPKYNNIPINYEHVGCFHQKYVKEHWKNDGEFLFKVGL